MNQQAVDDWLKKYGRAWETKDLEAFASLFTPDASYHWTPFEPPKLGRAAIAGAVKTATDRQKDIRFSYTVLAGDGNHHVAHWHCEFVRVSSGKPVRLDGIFQLEFDSGGLCAVFREWWHSDEFE